VRFSDAHHRTGDWKSKAAGISTVLSARIRLVKHQPLRSWLVSIVAPRLVGMGTSRAKGAKDAKVRGNDEKQESNG